MGVSVRCGNQRRNKMKQSILLEIRAAEGGDDAKLLVNDQMGVYLKLAKGYGL